MARRPLTAFRIDADLLAALQAVKERHGVPISEQVRRALRLWVKLQGEGRRLNVELLPTAKEREGARFSVELPTEYREPARRQRRSRKGRHDK